MEHILISLALGLILLVECCRRPPGQEGPDDDEHHGKNKTKGGPMQPNKTGWHEDNMRNPGWGPPENASAGWGSGAALLKNMTKYKNGTLDDSSIISDFDPNLPDGWSELGPGEGAAVPPPWAYIPGGAGKPDFCFLPPVRGPCFMYQPRWGFNPHVNKCVMFPYSGCGGNQNNFVSRALCEAACTDTPASNCEEESPFIDHELTYSDDLR